MMTVLLAPAFLFLYFAALGAGRESWLRIVRAIPVFLLGLTPYLYLPIRAAARPVVNWGDPSTLSSFWAHVSAAQYRFKMFSSSQVAQGKLLAFARELPGDFAWVALPFAAIGFWILLRRSPRLAAVTVLLFATCVLYAVNYDFDDPNFRLHAHIMVALWAAFGLHAGLRALLFSAARLRVPRTRIGAALPAFGCALLVLVPFDANYRTVDRSADRAVEDYARAVLASAEPGALILSGDLEGFVAGSRYLQIAEGLRTDVAVVGLGILVFPWYYGELEAAHPGLARGVAAELDAYIPERRRIERGVPSDIPYDLAFTRVVRALLRESVARRPTYVSFVPPDFFREYEVVPQGLLARVSRDPELPALPAPALPPRPIAAELPYAPKVVAGYASAFLNHSMYHLRRGEDAEAARLLRSMLELDSGNVAAREMLQAAQGRR
jgi:hypothetical protein